MKMICIYFDGGSMEDRKKLVYIIGVYPRAYRRAYPSGGWTTSSKVYIKRIL